MWYINTRYTKKSTSVYYILLVQYFCVPGYHHETAYIPLCTLTTYHSTQKYFCVPLIAHSTALSSHINTSLMYLHLIIHYLTTRVPGTGIYLCISLSLSLSLFTHINITLVVYLAPQRVVGEVGGYLVTMQPSALPHCMRLALAVFARESIVTAHHLDKNGLRELFQGMLLLQTHLSIKSQCRPHLCQTMTHAQGFYAGGCGYNMQKLRHSPILLCT